MKYFLDTEFIERGPSRPLMLISIGVVAEDGREFYRENTVSLARRWSPWLEANVWPHLKQTPDVLKKPTEIATDMLAFIGDDPEPEFWGYFSDYDWVIVCQLFGDMSKKPPIFPYRCNDLRQALDHEALSHISQPDDAAHNALTDARWIAATWREHLNWQREKEVE